MAAASDCVRILEPAIRLFANYVDLDVGYDLRRVQVKHQVHVPVVIGGGILRTSVEGQVVTCPAINSHFLGLAVTSEDDASPHRSLKSVHFYTGLSSCFSQAGCGDVFSITTEPSCPQASIPVELTVLSNCSRHTAAL